MPAGRWLSLFFLGCWPVGRCFSVLTCRIQNPDIPQARRDGAPGGADGRGRARLGANRIIRPGNKKSTVPSKASKKRRVNVSPEARTSEILCKPKEERFGLCMTRGLSPVYQRFISGTRSALCSWLPTGGTTPLCLCKPFSCKACPGNIFMQGISSNLCIGL